VCLKNFITTGNGKLEKASVSSVMRGEGEEKAKN
jgi:hypothetical protein